MAAYLRTRLPHFRHAALSLHKAKILPCFHSSNDAIALFPPRTANVKAFHNDTKQDGIDNYGTLGIHDSVKKELPPVLVKKVDDGGVLEPHAVVEKGGVSNSKLDAADDGGAQDSYISMAEFEKMVSDYLKDETRRVNEHRALFCQEHDETDKLKKKEKSGKTSKKRVPVVVSLCNATRVRDIVHFPPEILQDNRRLLQLFKAWKKEWNVSYGSNAEEMYKFHHFKFNVARYDNLNRKEGRECRLDMFADCIDSYTWIGRNHMWCCEKPRAFPP